MCLEFVFERYCTRGIRRAGAQISGNLPPMDITMFRNKPGRSLCTPARVHYASSNQIAQNIAAPNYVI